MELIKMENGTLSARGMRENGGAVERIACKCACCGKMEYKRIRLDTLRNGKKYSYAEYTGFCKSAIVKEGFYFCGNCGRNKGIQNARNIEQLTAAIGSAMNDKIMRREQRAAACVKERETAEQSRKLALVRLFGFKRIKRGRA